ncbi:MAG: leucine-rich repeat domain-containing protein [Bacteroidales bacterium]|nr:leucine-rich repeat domain-containing protein [Bacteroidales bacterium]
MSQVFDFEIRINKKKTNQNDRIGKIIRNIFLKFVGMTKLKKKYIDNGDFGIGEDINTKSVNDKSKIPDVAHDRKALRYLLQTMIVDLQSRNITPQNWMQHYTTMPKFEYMYDSELKECVMYVVCYNEERYEMHMKVENTHWKTKECLIAESNKLYEVLERLNDRNLVDKLYNWIYLLEEGVVEERVVIPKGITRIAPMMLDSNDRTWRKKKNKNIPEGFPLYQYGRIGTLVIPASIEIPHDDRYSPFASYKQRAFVWNHPTEWQKIHIRNIENHSPHLLVEDGVLYSADKSRLIYCFEEKRSFVVSQSVTTIEPYAFCLQKGLKEVVLHDGITTIGNAAFMACSTLEEVVIPKQIKKIPDDCFDGCTSLCEVTLPDGLEGIENCAFRQCKALKAIQLPAGLKYVRGFEGCSELREIEIPAGIEKIESFGFMFCDSLRKVVLHKGVKRIDGYAFRYCDNLKEINFPEGLEYIGDRAFYPASLNRVSFPASLQEIGSEAFYHNGKLHFVEFKSNVEKIGKAAFACCPLLFKKFISKPSDMEIKDDVFIQDTTFDKFCFWD